MGIQETKRRQEEQLALAKQSKPQPPVAQPEPTTQPVVDVQVLRQMIENVVHAELQGIRSEQPQPLDMQMFQQAVRSIIRAELQTMRDEQPHSQQSSVVDMQSLQHAVQSVVRAELQPLQAAVTIMANAIQAQTDALMAGEGDEENQEQDEPLPTASPHHTDDIEDEQFYPPDDEELDDEEEPDEALDDVGDEDEEEEGYPAHPPRPESPTHRLRRPGPVGLLLGSDLSHPSTGPRRWEPVI